MKISKKVKSQKAVAIGDKQLNPKWEHQRKEAVRCRDVSSWLFAIHKLLHTSKYRICKSVDGETVKWRYSKQTGKIKIHPTNTFPYISTMTDFVKDYFEEILLDKKQKPRVVDLLDFEGNSVGKLVLQGLKTEEDGVEFTWVEVNVADIDEFVIPYTSGA